MQVEIMAGRAGFVAAEAARLKARRLVAQCGLWVVLAVCSMCLAAFADGSSGRFFSDLASFVVYLVVPVGALGLVAAGGLLAGNPRGTARVMRGAME